MGKKTDSVVSGGVDIDEVGTVLVDIVELSVVGIDVDEEGDDEEVDMAVVIVGERDGVVAVDVDVIVVHVVVDDVIKSAKQTSSSHTYIKVCLQFLLICQLWQYLTRVATTISTVLVARPVTYWVTCLLVVKSKSWLVFTHS